MTAAAVSVNVCCPVTGATQSSSPGILSIDRLDAENGICGLPLGGVFPFYYTLRSDYPVVTFHKPSLNLRMV